MSTASTKANNNVTFIDAMLRKKPVDDNSSSVEDKPALKPTLSFKYVVLYGIAGVVGAGIFESPAKIIREQTGPAVVLSFMIAAIACAFTGICYADFAAKHPSAGGSYAYIYSSLGEYCAFLAGVGNTFEYAFSGAAVARSWSGYLQALFPSLAIAQISMKGAIISPDIYAPMISLAMAAICLLGVKQSTKLSAILTVTNISAIIFIICVGASYIDTSNYTPFFPFPASGIFRGSTDAIFSFIGWDAVCVLSEDVKEPKKTIPRAIFTVLGLASVLYCCLLAVLTGMKPFTEIAPVASLISVFPQGHYAQYVISVLVLLCSTNTTYATTQGNPMIWYSMARDGLLPAKFRAVDKNNTPYFSVIGTGILMVCISGLFNFDFIAGATTSAVLLVQGLVCLGCLLGRVDSQDYAANKGSIKTCLAINVFAIVACAGFYGETNDTLDAATVLAFVYVQWFLVAVAAVTGLLVVCWSKTYGSLIPLIALMTNFFLVGISGFWALAQLAIILASFSLLYFSYGLTHSKLAI